MKKSWEKIKGKEVNYLQLFDNKIVVGSHMGNGHTDVAGSCTIEEFITGTYQDIIIDTFGKKILNELLQIIKKPNNNDI